MDINDLHFIKTEMNGISTLLSNYTHLTKDTKEQLLKAVTFYMDKNCEYVFPCIEDPEDKTLSYIVPEMNRLSLRMQVHDYSIKKMVIDADSLPAGMNKVYVAFDVPNLHQILNWRKSLVVIGLIKNKLESAPLENLKDFQLFEENLRSVLLAAGIYDLSIYRKVMLLYEDLFLLIGNKNFGEAFGPSAQRYLQKENTYREGLDGMIQAEENDDKKGMIEMEILFRSSFTSYNDILDLTQNGDKLYSIQCLSANKEFYSVNLTACVDNIINREYAQATISKMSTILTDIVKEGLTGEISGDINFGSESGLPEDIKRELFSVNIKERILSNMAVIDSFIGVSEKDINLDISGTVLKALCYFIHTEKISEDETIFYDPRENLHVYRTNGEHFVLCTVGGREEDVYAVSIYQKSKLIIFSDLEKVGKRIYFAY